MAVKLTLSKHFKIDKFQIEYSVFYIRRFLDKNSNDYNKKKNAQLQISSIQVAGHACL